MKINEIIDTSLSSVKTNTPFNLDDLKKDHIERKGSQGWYAYGKETNDPHVFQKATHFPSLLKNDAYHAYVKAIRPYMKSNPFFPRIYNITTKKDNEGRIIPQYDIETLKSWEDYPIETLVGVGEALFPGFEEATFKLVHGKYAEFDVASQIANRLQAYCKGETPGWKSYVTYNTKLLQACKLINDVIKGNKNFTEDMHCENFMFRGTPAGPQLVLTDPISDNGKSIMNTAEKFLTKKK